MQHARRFVTSPRQLGLLVWNQRELVLLLVRVVWALLVLASLLVQVVEQYTLTTAEIRGAAEVWRDCADKRATAPPPPPGLLRWLFLSLFFAEAPVDPCVTARPPPAFWVRYPQRVLQHTDWCGWPCAEVFTYRNAAFAIATNFALLRTTGMSLHQFAREWSRRRKLRALKRQSM